MTLLRVPREIRDAIIEFVLLGNFPDAPVDAPTATKGLRALSAVELAQQQTSPRLSGRHGNHHYGSSYTCNSHRFLDARCFMSSSAAAASEEFPSAGDLPVFYQTVENPALALLLTCHQLHAEVTDVIRRCQRRPTEYTADVMFVNNVGLWTTWLSVPVRRTVTVDTLRANFRLCGAPRDLARGIYKRDMWDGDGGVANMMTLAMTGGVATPSWSSSWSNNTSNGAWGLYDLLNGLLEGNIGPWPARRHAHPSFQRSKTGSFRVKRLVLNITSAVSGSDVLSLSEIDTWASTSQLPAAFLPPSKYYNPSSSSSSCWWQTTSNHKVAAVTFARLVQFLLSILQSPIHRRVYGVNLFHQVGVVEVQVDGQRYGNEVDLSKSLDDLSWLGEEEEEEGEDNAGSPFREELVADLLEWQSRTVERRRLAGFGTVEVLTT